VASAPQRSVVASGFGRSKGHRFNLALREEKAKTKAVYLMT
jgi:hypothetical protein